jgi:hypothetical protein
VCHRTGNGLSLYDDERLRGPLWLGKPVKWEEIDRHALESLRLARQQKRAIVLLSGTINSPSTNAIIRQWEAQFPNFRHISYEPVSVSALSAATAASFGQAVIPHYRFDRARVMVGLEADFLGTWLSPVEFARDYAAARAAGTAPALHVQFESGMSLTGSNADIRVAVTPSHMGLIAVALLHRVLKKTGVSASAEGADPIDTHTLDLVAEQL